MTSDGPGNDLASRREDYARGGLSETDLTADPLALFERWYADAVAAGLHEPNAMAVATASPDGFPSARFVLLKGVTPDGFVFYTNLGSRKGRDLLANPRCALLFPWNPLERQVRVEGHAAELSRAEVESYFTVRPRGSQLGAWASHQSTVVSGRAELDQAYDAAAARFDGVDVPVPDEWGGFRVRPERVEFWQGRTGRMHDRLVYRRTTDGWATERLAP
jgi:pyridoxamine 5'-phosphate oxidase